MIKPTLFLDRDGVINKFEPGKYVNTVEDFIFETNSLVALKTLSDVFGRIFVVSNQQGVARGFLTTDDLNEIHSYMLEKVEQAGGRIDHVYTCTAMEPSNCRKPNTGMALQAKRDYPEIDFFNSIMVGDFISDMQFGIHLGMTTVFIGKEVQLEHAHLIDFCYESLYEFSIVQSKVQRNIEEISK